MILKTYGFDSYNQAAEEEISQPLRAHGGGYDAESNTNPCVR